MGLLIFYLSLALGVSFLCSIMEAVLLSSSISYIEMKEAEGKKAAVILKNYKNNIDRPLSAILSINTIAHTIGAAGVGAQAARVFENISFGVISGVLTVLILIFSEIIPKTIGAIYWRNISLVSAHIIRIMVIISYPLVVIAEFITKWIASDNKQGTINRDEIAALARLGKKEGVFEEKESKVINNIIKLKSISVRDIMTPRTVVVAVSENLSVGEIHKIEEYLSFSRIPVYIDEIDNVTGYVLKDTVLSKLAEDKHTMKLNQIKRPITVVNENMPAPELFEQLLMNKEHIALVVDEYGGTEGIVTMEDIIEALLGLEIVDESDRQVDMQKAAKEKWKKRVKEHKNAKND